MSLGNETFRLLRDMIYEQSGIFFPESKKYLLENRLRRRLEERNCQTFEDYYYFLKYDPGREGEFLCLFDVVTTNETSFFRDPGQLMAFENGVLHTLVKEKETRGEKRLRFWSAGCSTGEEPYTLAIIIIERQEQLKNWTVEIMASDISEGVLQSAKRAIYNQNAIRNTPPAILTRYFRNSGGNYAVKEEVKNLVRFYRLNLFDQARVRAVRGMDVVFCRNVLIYFTREEQARILARFAAALPEGGALVLGRAETLAGKERQLFQSEFPAERIYRRTAQAIDPAAIGQQGV